MVLQIPETVENSKPTQILPAMLMTQLSLFADSLQKGDFHPPLLSRKNLRIIETMDNQNCVYGTHRYGEIPAHTHTHPHSLIFKAVQYRSLFLRLTPRQQSHSKIKRLSMLLFRVKTLFWSPWPCSTSDGSLSCYHCH